MRPEYRSTDAEVPVQPPLEPAFSYNAFKSMIPELIRRFIRRLCVLVAIGAQLAGLVLFLNWASKSDLMFGHFKGPLSLLDGAAGLSGLGIAAGVCLLFLGDRPKPSWRWLPWGALCLISTGVIATAVSERRTRQERLERQLAALHSPDDSKREWAAYMLGALGDETSEAELIEIEKNDPSDKVRKAAHSALESMKQSGKR
jgi:hypothetical protein